MKKIICFGYLICILAWQACAQNSKINTLDVTQFDTKTQEPNTQILDVRTPEEFDGGFIKNAKNINVNSATFETEIKKLDPKKTTLVYCLSGGRSAQACNILIKNGFEKIYNLDGGILQWRLKAKPLVIENPFQKQKGITLKEFEKLTHSDTAVLVDFNAPWCVPCKKLKPELITWQQQNPAIFKLVDINIDNNQEIADAYKISMIPYLQYYKKGKLLWTIKGYPNLKSLRKKLDIK